MDTPAVIEKELHRKPPRRVINRDGKWGSVRPWLLILLPHFWIAVIAPFVWFALLLDTFVALPIPGTVTAHRQQLGKKNNSVYYLLDYEFKTFNKTTKSFNQVDKTRYDSLKDGDQVTVYGLPWLPWFSPRLVKDGNYGIFVFATVWCSIWCGCMFGILYAMLNQPLRCRYLTRSGTPILATINSIQTVRGQKSNAYKVCYTYQAKTIDKKSGKKISSQLNGTMTIRSADYSQALSLQGHQTTALIDDKNPYKSILYSFSDYRAIN